MGRMKEKMIRMAHQQSIRNALDKADFLKYSGAYAVVDGQFGSTGKGLLAGLLAELYHGEVASVTSNAGPNSGHTSYYNGEKIVLRQLPTFGVVSALIERSGSHPPVKSTEVLLNAGAIIDLDVLIDESNMYRIPVWVDPFAAVVTPESKENEAGLVSAIGSTGKGTGAALAAKVMRKEGSVVWDWREYIAEKSKYVNIAREHLAMSDLGLQTMGNGPKHLIEISQGFSLGINEGMFPYTTSRQCTVAQAISDANMHPSQLRGSAMVVRTYPIRVAGNSGPCYPDQVETSWEALGVPPELTTVTQKVRRVFTWSRTQFRHAVAANRPSVILLNFCNYMEDQGQLSAMIRDLKEDYRAVMSKNLPCLLGGFGPTSDEVVVL